MALAAAGVASSTARAQDAATSTDAKSPAQAPANGPEANILQEVVVTAARKRTENVQTTPIAVTAISPQVLDRVHATDLNDIANLVPNLQIHEVTGATAGMAGIYLRGFGTSQSDPSADPAIPVYVDGIYQSQVHGSQLDLFGESIEVLRGPQGTLYGKNAPTGAINVTSLRPTGDYSGKVQFDYGSFDKTEVRALVNIPLVKDVLSMNVAGSWKYLGNWYYNDAQGGKPDAGGQNNQNVRVGILYTPNSNLTWYTTLTYEHYDENMAPLQSFANNVAVQPYQQVTAACLLGGYCNISPTPYHYFSLYDNKTPSTAYDFMTNIEYKFDAVTLTSVTGYRIYQQEENQDFSRVPAYFGIDERETLNENQESEEIRLSSNKGGGLTLGDRLDWVIGGYYGRDRYADVQPVFVYGGALPVVFGGAAAASFVCGNVSLAICGINAADEQAQLTQSLAYFAHAIYNITNDWTLSFGARQSWDHKDHNTAAALTIGAPNNAPSFGLPFYQKAGFHNLSFEAGTQYQIDKDKMVYFRFAQGYRAGGVQATVASQSPLFPAYYGPETVNSFEVGTKTDWFDHRLRVNADVFQNDYDGLQRDLTFFAPGPVQVIVNAASATVRGMELETTIVPTENLTIRANAGYITTTYHQFAGNLESGVAVGPYDESLNLGQKFPYTPHWTTDLGFTYVYDLGNLGSTSFSGDWHWQTSENLNDETIPIAEQPSYGTVSLSLRWDDPTDTYSVSFYGQNILNRLYKTYLVPALGDIGTYGMPATWGMSLSAKF